jgi:hypothetical protein
MEVRFISCLSLCILIAFPTLMTPPALSDAAWDALATAIKTQLQTPNTTASLLVSDMLKIIDNFFEDGVNLKLATNALIVEIGHLALVQCEKVLETDQGEELALENSVTSLVTLLDAFGPKLFHDPEFTKVRN